MAVWHVLALSLTVATVSASYYSVFASSGSFVVEPRASGGELVA